MSRAPERHFASPSPWGTRSPQVSASSTCRGPLGAVARAARRMRGSGGQLARQREYRLRVSATSFGKADIVSPQANIVCAKHNLVRRRRHRFRRQAKISLRAERAFFLSTRRRAANIVRVKDANIVCAERKYHFRRQAKISLRAKRAFPPLPTVS